MASVGSRIAGGALLLAATSFGLGGCESARDAKPQQAMQDAAVSAAVQAKLTGDRSSNFTRVDVRAHRGVLSLSGVVPSVRDRDRAEELARQIEGVTSVNNALTVRNHRPDRTGRLNE